MRGVLRGADVFAHVEACSMGAFGCRKRARATGAGEGTDEEVEEDDDGGANTPLRSRHRRQRAQPGRASGSEADEDDDDGSSAASDGAGGSAEDGSALGAESCSHQCAGVCTVSLLTRMEEGCRRHVGWDSTKTTANTLDYVSSIQQTLFVCVAASGADGSEVSEEAPPADDDMYEARLAQWKARRRQRSAAGAPLLSGHCPHMC